MTGRLSSKAQQIWLIGERIVRLLGLPKPFDYAVVQIYKVDDELDRILRDDYEAKAAAATREGRAPPERGRSYRKGIGAHTDEVLRELGYGPAEAEARERGDGASARPRPPESRARPSALRRSPLGEELLRRCWERDAAEIGEMRAVAVEEAIGPARRRRRGDAALRAPIVGSLVPVLALDLHVARDASEGRVALAKALNARALLVAEVVLAAVALAVQERTEDGRRGGRCGLQRRSLLL